MNDEAVALVGQRIAALKLPRPITASQATGKNIAKISADGASIVTIEFSDNTVLFLQGECRHDGDAYVDDLAWPESADVYVYDYLAKNYPEVAEHLRADIKAIEDKAKAAEEERWDRETYERLKAKFGT
jgi:hypothetical protein